MFFNSESGEQILKSKGKITEITKKKQLESEGAFIIKHRSESGWWKK